MSVEEHIRSRRILFPEVKQQKSIWEESRSPAEIRGLIRVTVFTDEEDAQRIGKPFTPTDETMPMTQARKTDLFSRSFTGSRTTSVRGLIETIWE